MPNDFDLIKNTIFERRVFEMNAAYRSLSRIVSYIFAIILVGIMFSLFISDLPNLKWGGVFLALFFIDYITHLSSSHYSIREFFKGKVPSNNIALCIDRRTMQKMVSAFEKVQIFGGNLYVSLLISFFEMPSIRRAIERMDIKAEDFKSVIEGEFDKSSKLNQLSNYEDSIEAFRQISIRAAIVASAHLKPHIDSEAFFAAIAYSENKEVSRILDLFSISADDIDAAIVFSNFIFSRKRVPDVTGGFALKSYYMGSKINRTFTSKPTPTLDKFSRDITGMARAGMAGFLIGHRDEYDEMIGILSRAGNKNVMLIGDPGVGKETIVHYLAFNIVTDNVSAPLFDRRLVELSIGELISGASYEELSKRLSNVANDILGAGNIVLYIPDIHNLARTAQGGGGGINLSDILMPILRNNLFPVIGATSPREYKEFIGSRGDFSSMFGNINVKEINQKDAIILLTYDAIILERKYKTKISFSAIKQAVILSSKYLKTKPLPSSAQELLRESISDANYKGLKKVSGDEVISVVERKVNIPVHKAGKQESEALLNLENTIHKKLIDQEEAVSSVARALKQYRSGLSKKGGPISVFLFVGPTGVGKTELSKILAEINFGSEKQMVRLDMSEYQQKDMITRLIGSSDGKMAGLLTESIMQKPYSLVLLDEFEKAHPDILNIFLQVFDDGRLTDNFGRVVDFQNTIIIATSNAESVFIQERLRAGERIENFGDELKKRLTSYFKPELLNRFSDVIIFKSLSADDINKIAKLKLSGLSKIMMSARGVVLNFDESAAKKISEIGYDPAFGARPLDRAIDKHLKSVLSDKILSGEIERGSIVNVKSEEGKDFIFEISSN